MMGFQYSIFQHLKFFWEILKSQNQTMQPFQTMQQWWEFRKAHVKQF